MIPRSFRSRVTAIGIITLAIVLGLGSWVTVRALAAGARSDINAQNIEVLDLVAEEILAGGEPQNVRLPIAQDGTEFVIFNSDDQPVNLSAAFVTESIFLSPEEFDRMLAEDLPIPGVAPPFEVFATDFESGVTGGLAPFAMPVSVASPADFLRTSRNVATPGGEAFTLTAATPLETVTRGIGRLVFVLSVIIPTLIILGGLALWFALGAALEPVQRISAEASRIAPSNSGRRLPVPNSGDEIASMTITLNTMLDRLDSGLIRQQQFVSDASHELRSPLTSVKASAELAALDPTLSADTAESLDAVRRGAARLADVLDDLTQLAVGVETPMVLAAVDVLILEEVEALSEQGVSVDFQTAQVETVKAPVHAIRISRAIRNVLDNAVRHAISVVEVSASIQDSMVVITIDDDGQGVADLDRTTIFERFVRLDEGRNRAHGGSGLGLALVATIVDEHDGTVSCGTSPQGGARFTMRLPT